MALLSKELTDALNEQIAHELSNYLFYNAIENHYQKKNWNGFASFFHKQAQGEIEHSEKIRSFMFDKNADVKVIAPIISIIVDSDDEEDIMQMFYERELATTEKINAIYELAKGNYKKVAVNGKVDFKYTNCDPSVIQWLESFLIPEQVEEEALALDMIAKVKMTTNILILDEQLKG